MRLELGFSSGSISSVMAGGEQFAVFTTADTTIFHIFNTTPATQITFIGANGAKYQTTANNVTTDVGAQGLTAPVTMRVSLSTFASMNVMHIGGNQLAGRIPALPASLIILYCFTNQLTGSIPSLPASINTVYCYENQLAGSIPALPSSLVFLNCGSNQLTGSIPALPALLEELSCASNQLTGSIPALPSSLQFLHCAINELTGSIPALPASLMLLHCAENQLTGSIPAVPSSLVLLYCFDNQLTGYDGASVTASLGDVQCQDNLLTQAAVDAILVQLDTAGRTSASGTCVCNLGGTGNAAPGVTGVTAKGNLIGKGWTVTTN